MNEMTLQEKVVTIVRNLMKTSEFQDHLEIAKGLMYLTFVAQCHQKIFTEVLKTRSLQAFRAIPWEFMEIPPVDFTVIKSDETLALLIEAFSEIGLTSPADRRLFANLLINHITAISGKQFGAIVPTTPEVAGLIAFISAELRMDSVFDPFASVPMYAVAPEFEGILFRGSEISPDASSLGNLLLAIKGEKMSIKTSNYLREWDRTELSEGIISIPPFGLNIRNEVQTPTTSRTAEEFIIERFLESAISRKAIIMVPMSFTLSDRTEWLRERLLEWDAIDMVISLPSGLLNSTLIPSLMLVLDRDKTEEREGKITFISLLDCIMPDGKHSMTINLEKAKSKVASRKGKYVEIMDLSSVNNDNFDINPGTYLTKFCAMFTNENVQVEPLCVYLFPLEKELKRVKLGTTQNVVGLNDLSSIYNFAPLSETPATKTSSRFFEINKDAIVIGNTSDAFKVARYYRSEKPLCLSDRLTACEVYSSVETDYLLLELTKPYVSEQIRLLNLPPIYDNVDYLLNKVYVVSESSERQLRIVKKAKDAYVAILHKDISSIQEDFRKDVHIKRHAIGQTIASIGSWWTLLEQVRQKGNIINEDIMLEGLDVSVKEVLDNIKVCFGRLSTQIDKFDRGYNSKPEIFNLYEFCQEYMASHKSPLFNYEFLAPYYLVDSSYPIYFPKDVLLMICNNIISNACSHGFNNEPQPENIVRFFLMETSEGYQLGISNNGMPCKVDMTPEKMVAYGESSDLKKHCGIGCYEIKQLTRDFGAQFEIALNSMPNFPVEYRLTFNSVEDEHN